MNTMSRKALAKPHPASAASIRLRFATPRQELTPYESLSDADGGAAACCVPRGFAGASRIVCLLLGLCLAMPVGAELVLVKEGKALAPIVIFADAPPLTRRAADELAHYIEKTSGARPEVCWKAGPTRCPNRPSGWACSRC